MKRVMWAEGVDVQSGSGGGCDERIIPPKDADASQRGIGGARRKFALLLARLLTSLTTPLLFPLSITIY